MQWDIAARDRSAAGFRSFDRRVDRSERGVYRLGAAMDRASGLTTRLAGAAAALAGLGVGARAIRGIVEETSRLAKDADKVGLLTDEFQRLQFGFGQAGVEASNFTTAMEQFNKRLTEAQTGTGNLKKILDANNVSLFDSNGNMKSVNTLLGEYAELIKNAETSQNRLYLATEAFGRSGGDMVLALRYGAEGMAKLSEEADDAGGVIDEELLRSAEEFDDAWSRASRRFEVNMKSAVLSVITGFDDLTDAIDQAAESGEGVLGEFLQDLRQRSEAQNAHEAGLAFGQLVGAGGDVVLSKTSRLPANPEDPLDAFGGPGDFQYSGPRTIIPTTPGRKSSTSKAARHDQVLAGLRLEYELLGQTAQRQREINALRAAGVDAASERGQMILAEVEQINRKELALLALEEQQKAIEDQQLAFGESMSYLADIGVQAFDAWISGAEDAGDALKRMGVQVLALLAKGALLGEGPLAGLFGGGGFGFGFGSTAASFGGQAALAASGSFAGLFADGGQIGAGQWGIAGEAGPEVISGPATVTPIGDILGPVSAPAAGRTRDTLDVRISVTMDNNGNLQAFVQEQAAQTADNRIAVYDQGSLARQAENHLELQKEGIAK